MKNLIVVLVLLISYTCTIVFGLAQQIDPKYLLAPLQSQRDRANNELAFCGAEVARLRERVTELEKELSELKTKQQQ